MLCGLGILQPIWWLPDMMGTARPAAADPQERLALGQGSSLHVAPSHPKLLSLCTPQVCDEEGPRGLRQP